MKTILLFILFLFAQTGMFGQNSLSEEQKELVVAPSKAAFYSAVVPGLGQIYNKSYWKLPIVYGGMGATLYYYFKNHNTYTEFRNIYKRRLLGFKDDKYNNVDNDRIISIQKQAQKNRDLSLVLTIGVYILNIIDANVDAHLQQFNIDDNLSIQPMIGYDNALHTHQIGVNAVYRF